LRLVSSRESGGLKAGILVDATVVGADEAAQAADLDPSLGRASIRCLLAAGAEQLAALEAAAVQLAAAGRGRPLVEVDLGPPVPDPDKIVCIGLNYREHAREAGLELPLAPPVFAKFRNSLVGPVDEIVLPRASHDVDYEAELAVVIGAVAKNVPVEHALDYVAGVMVFNDLSARDLQMQTSQWTAGKAIDDFAPCGPALVLLDEVPDLQALAIRAIVNGTVVQDGNTADMIFSVAEIVAFLAQLMTLEPGDIIATGTPAGVGFSRQPPLLLAPGDIVEVEIEGVGALRNPIAAPAAVVDRAAVFTT
jgi:acylpyruvate hydrolase